MNYLNEKVEELEFLRPHEKKKIKEKLEKEEYIYLYNKIKNKISLNIKLDKVYSAQRPRMGQRGFYAPDSKYKTAILKEVKKLLENNTVDFNYNYIELEIIAYFKHKPKNKYERVLGIFGFLPVIKRPDVDNIAKIYMDACNGYLWKDDCDITSLKVQKIYSEEEYLIMNIIYK